ncbi:hypothetical protein LOK49_LG03G03185 [Camellia lanceoleosa]|uniref:Uncharacterized protein n=1 Tax=Camellia lanceoleosa TaxID=1840588 RepID=A0ACC0IFM9_9ERIC|nr:hypothetical protein LOK49_LG03G03185 [Camellia lanceoleosa]
MKIAVFVKPTARFMITDDFQVLPMSTMTGLSLLSKLGAMDESKIEERTVNIGKDEVLKLLNCSLASRTPFSDTFVEPPIIYFYFQLVMSSKNFQVYAQGCMDNIYKSIQDFEDKFFQSEEMKAILVDPKLAQGLACSNKLIGIEEAINPSLSTLSSLFTNKMLSVEFRVPPKEAKISGGFMKGPSMFMVTDNLLIKPISPISGISLINRLKVP